MNKLNRLSNLGIGLGLCLISGTALAHGPQVEQRPDRVPSFYEYDINHDRMITRREMQQRDLIFAQAEFNRLDRNRDQVLSPWELRFVSADEPCHDGHGSQPVLRTRWDGVRDSNRDQYFARFDYSGASGLTWEVARRQSIDQSWSFFSRADVNNNGVVNPAELAAVQFPTYRGTTYRRLAQRTY